MCCATVHTVRPGFCLQAGCPVQGLDALSFVGRATLEWGKAGVDAANQALTKLDEAGDTWLHGWDSPSALGQIPARHGPADNEHSPWPRAQARPADSQAWTPFGFHDDSASEAAASPPGPVESPVTITADEPSPPPGEMLSWQAVQIATLECMAARPGIWPVTRCH